MGNKRFSAGRIREISHDPRDGYLELVWDNQRVSAYRPVPKEVFDRLCKAPNPTTYFADRIEEEYPQVEPVKKRNSATANKNLNDLFGD
jgi:hypothetical protein